MISASLCLRALGRLWVGGVPNDTPRHIFCGSCLCAHTRRQRFDGEYRSNQDQCLWKGSDRPANASLSALPVPQRPLSQDNCRWYYQ